MIRDEVIVVEILEQAGQQIANREVRDGPIERLYGFAWVTVRNVAISRLRRSPYLLERSTVGSARIAVAVSRLTAEESSPSAIEYRILLAQVLARLSARERMIAIWKQAGHSSKEIADHLAEKHLGVLIVFDEEVGLANGVVRWGELLAVDGDQFLDSVPLRCRSGAVEEVLLGNGQHAPGAARRVVNGDVTVRNGDREQFDHEADDFARGEVFSSLFAALF